MGGFVTKGPRLHKLGVYFKLLNRVPYLSKIGCYLCGIDILMWENGVKDGYQR